MLVAQEKEKKNELELSKTLCFQPGFERVERLGVLQSRREEVVPEHRSSRLEGARTIASLAGIVMVARDREMAP